jgi:hypothetical protein
VSLVLGRGLRVSSREPPTRAGHRRRGDHSAWIGLVVGQAAEQPIQVVFLLRMDGALRHGLMVQLPEYLRASGADSAFLVCIGFAEEDKLRYERFVEDSVQDWRRNHPMIFLHTVFVDARRRTGASSS